MGRRILWILMLAFLSMNHEYAHAAEKRCVIVVVNGLSLEDWLEAPMPNLHEMMLEGSIALMNTNTGGARTPANAFASIGFGRPMLGEGSELSFNTRESLDGRSVDELMYARMGIEGRGKVVMLGLPVFERANEGKDFLSMGDVLEEGMINRAVMGNADLPGNYHREIVGMVADRNGQVDMGVVDDRTLKPGKTVSWETDYSVLLKMAKELIGNTGLTIIQLGDIDRLGQIEETLRPAIWQKEKERFLAQADSFLRELDQELTPEDLFIVISATPSPAAQKDKNLLVPLLAKGGTFQSGLIYSPATRRDGIVSNGDLAPTVLAHFGLTTPPSMLGRALRTSVLPEGPLFLATLNKRLVFTYVNRPLLIKTFVMMEIITISLTVVSLFFKRTLLKFLRPVLLWLMTIPWSLLVVGSTSYQSLTMYMIKTSLVGILVVVAAQFLARKSVAPYIFISLVTAVTLVVDLGMGANLIKQSVLGYDPIAGARYYGIGNEYMGVLIGSTIIGATGMLKEGSNEKVKLIGLFSSFTIATAFIGLPWLGSNVGGTIAGVVGFSVTLLGLATKRIQIVQLLGLAAFSVVLILFLGWLDFHRQPALQSHLGRLVTQIMNGDPGMFVDVIIRKINMNVKLIRYTVWSRVFLVMLVSMSVLLYRPASLIRPFMERYPQLMNGMIGVTVGSVAALVANDSGIVAAATMMIYPVTTMLHLSMKTDFFS